jgi:thiol-disulfide isomerase/thioredoxin
MLKKMYGGDIRGMIPSFSVTNILLFILVIAIIGVGYYFIQKTLKAKSSANANNEGRNQQMTSNKEAELMLFYVDWCPHCKTAKPEWEQVKTEYQDKMVNGYTIIMTEINCTKESPDVEKMVNNYRIEGYPTIKLLKDGQVIEFDAKPTKANLTQFLNTAV